MSVKISIKIIPHIKTEAAFFLAAAYAFKGRLYSDEERKNWRKAVSAGTSALDYLEDSKEKEGLNPELVIRRCALQLFFSLGT